MFGFRHRDITPFSYANIMRLLLIDIIISPLRHFHYDAIMLPYHYAFTHYAAAMLMPYYRAPWGAYAAITCHASISFICHYCFSLLLRCYDERWLLLSPLPLCYFERWCRWCYYTLYAYGAPCDKDNIEIMPYFSTLMSPFPSPTINNILRYHTTVRNSIYTMLLCWLLRWCCDMPLPALLCYIHYYVIIRCCHAAHSAYEWCSMPLCHYLLMLPAARRCFAIAAAPCWWHFRCRCHVYALFSRFRCFYDMMFSRRYWLLMLLLSRHERYIAVADAMLFHYFFHVMLPMMTFAYFIISRCCWCCRVCWCHFLAADADWYCRCWYCRFSRQHFCHAMPPLCRLRHMLFHYAAAIAACCHAIIFAMMPIFRAFDAMRCRLPYAARFDAVYAFFSCYFDALSLYAIWCWLFHLDAARRCCLRLMLIFAFALICCRLFSLLFSLFAPFLLHADAMRYERYT